MKGKDGGGGESGAAAAQNLLSDKPEGGILQGKVCNLTYSYNPNRLIVLGNGFKPTD